MKMGHVLLLAAATLVSSACRSALPPTSSAPAAVGTNDLAGSRNTAGRTLFLKNCAHCHGADASGNEGPDLHNLDATDEWIGNRIQQGKAGQMTAFAGKLQASEINELIGYLRTLK